MVRFDMVGSAVATVLLAVVAPIPVRSSGSPPPDLQTITRLTNPLPLRPGEVTNTYHKLPIPPGPIAIYEFRADVVEKDGDGNIVPTPLSDAYLHHHVVFSEHEAHEREKRRWSPMKPERASRGVFFGAGTESRGTPQEFYHPFAFTTVEGEDELVANVHVINTRGMTPQNAHRCLECPCTSSDVSESDGAILGSVASRRRNWDACNADLVDEGNDACRPGTYRGGLLCCEEGEFCLEGLDPNSTDFDAVLAAGSVSTFYLRYTLSYAPATDENRPLSLAACCDASGNETMSGNVEYDIPKRCEEWESLDDDEACVHELSTVQTLHGPSSDWVFFGDLDGKDEGEGEEVDVVFMVGHLHRGGIDITARDAATGEVLCKSVPTYGAGDEIGNEKGYINGMSTCLFDPPRRMRTTDPILVTSSYDAREAHTGVMSLFYIAIAEVNDGTEVKRKLDRVPIIMQWAGVGVILACMAVALWKYVEKAKRMDYEMVPAGDHGQLNAI